MRALLDTNIVLDFFLDRQPFAIEAKAIFQANEQSRFTGYISAITPVNLFFIGRKFKGLADTQLAIDELLLAFEICPIDVTVLRAARQLPLTDFEDAVQLASAIANQLDCIVTRDLKDYTSSPLPILSPAEFLQQLP